MTGENRGLVLLVVLYACTLSGCGSDSSLPRAAVAGSVTLDGAPLVAGTIRFVPIDGTPGQKTSIPIEAGQFEASASNGPAVGQHRIEIESTDTGGLEMDDEEAIDRMRAEGTRRVKVVKVPPWYNQASGLQETVHADGPNDFSFELSTKRKR